MWTSSQRVRLAVEQKLVNREFPDFSMSWWENVAQFEGWHSPIGSGWYQLRLFLPPHYPDQAPNLYVVNPNPLLKRCGCCSINAEQRSHSFHTWENGPNGCVQICHNRFWDASQTSVLVILKGILWLRAYEAYWATSRPIAEFMRTDGSL